MTKQGGKGHNRDPSVAVVGSKSGKASWRRQRCPDQVGRRAGSGTGSTDPGTPRCPELAGPPRLTPALRARPHSPSLTPGHPQGRIGAGRRWAVNLPSGSWEPRAAPFAGFSSPSGEGLSGPVSGEQTGPNTLTPLRRSGSAPRASDPQALPPAEDPRVCVQSAGDIPRQCPEWPGSPADGRSASGARAGGAL